jgi:hypothetical protein
MAGLAPLLLSKRQALSEVFLTGGFFFRAVPNNGRIEKQNLDPLCRTADLYKVPLLLHDRCAPKVDRGDPRKPNRYSIGIWFAVGSFSFLTAIYRA